MAPARQQQTPQFNKDEKVLCFHMDMLYEAKVMDVQPGEKPGDGFRYKVHYKGWKNTWDDWVLADRIRPFDDEHKELAAQLHAQVKSSMQKNSKQPKKNLKGGDSARGSEERGSGAPQGGRGGRRGKDWELEQVRYFFFSCKLVVILRFGLACAQRSRGVPRVLAMSTTGRAKQTS
ncbi:histone acetylase complex subunit MRG15-2, partial [Metarhizium hybridum]